MENVQLCVKMMEMLKGALKQLKDRDDFACVLSGSAKK